MKNIIIVSKTVGFGIFFRNITFIKIQNLFVTFQFLLNLTIVLLDGWKNLYLH